MKLFKNITLLISFVFFSISSFAYSYDLDYLIENKLFSTDDVRLKEIKKLLESGNTEDALNNLYAFINEAEKKHDTLLIIESNKLLADILRENGDYLKSNRYFDKLLPLVKEDYKNLQDIFFKKGGNFQLEGEVDSAMINYEKALLNSEKISNDEDSKAKIHANLSGIYYLKEMYDKAIEHSKIAASYQEALGNKEIEAGILNNLGGIYYMQGKYKEALNSFQKALDIVGYGQDELQKKTRCTAFINMAYAYSGLNDFEKAFEFQDRYFSLNDSLQQELKYKEIAEIESKYNVATKEKEAEIEKSKRLKAEYLSIGLGLVTGISLLGLYILYKLYRLSKKNYKLQINQKQLIHQSKIEKIKSESQSKILVATLDGGIEERKKIATVLHDNVSALLSAANLHLYASKKQLKGDAPIEIEKSQKIIEEASEKIRDLSHKLISSVLLKFGLATAVQDLCEKSSNSEIQLHCKSKNIERFDQNFEIKIFNIITELVNNILKHSKAKNGTIKLEQLNGQLQVIVFDDGIGFDTAILDEKNGIGLSHVEARVKALKGLFEIKSANTGTRIFISVPIQY
ncbi:tetratricopeptide repeat protein [Lutibacter sp. B1]|uniref:tetratricopeptide repeat-containing sensor histidine kinase n=1 Tax=Lutibacter sp. B1 TaxID=2725996 RepID=UPI001456F663|nr:tetratricopeptide repeat protein [Lutibacter sp. B1]NLP58928.1 tetratricopeptide repeat protein [Lutibacter sp. B1]